MSAQKMREVVRQIQGMNALQAQAVLAVVPRKSARFVAKTLQSAIANAENNKGLKPEGLRIKEAEAQTATPMRRMTPKARGSVRKRYLWSAAAAKSFAKSFRGMRFAGWRQSLSRCTGPLSSPLR